jgi:ribonuclease BN (tRNA processing enzyme)
VLSMDIKILGAHNIESQNTRLVSLLIDDILAIDAGGLTSGLNFPAQLKLKAVLLSHQHYDHVRDIPAIGMSCFLHETTLDIYTTQPVCASLAAHMLNNEVYSNFLEKPAGNPTFRLKVLEPGRTDTICGYGVLPLPVNHTKPTVGFKITSPDGKTIFFTSDTGPGLADIWRRVSPQLLVIETTAPDRYESSALETGHLTPSLLRRELESFRDTNNYLPRIVLVHMNPLEEKMIKKEISAVAGALRADIKIGYEGMLIQL